MAVHFTSITRRVSIVAAASLLIVLVVNLDNNAVQNIDNDKPQRFKRLFPEKPWPKERDLPREKARLLDVINKYSGIISTSSRFAIDEYTRQLIRARMMITYDYPATYFMDGGALHTAGKILKFLKEIGVDPDKEEITIKVVGESIADLESEELLYIFGAAIYKPNAGEIEWVDTDTHTDSHEDFDY